MTKEHWATTVTRQIKCRHKWERLTTRVENRMVVATTERCEKCGAKRSSHISQPRTQTSGIRE